MIALYQGCSEFRTTSDVQHFFSRTLNTGKPSKTSIFRENSRIHVLGYVKGTTQYFLKKNQNAPRPSFYSLSDQTPTTPCCEASTLRLSFFALHWDFVRRVPSRQQTDDAEVYFIGSISFLLFVAPSPSTLHIPPPLIVLLAAAAAAAVVHVQAGSSSIISNLSCRTQIILDINIEQIQNP